MSFVADVLSASSPSERLLGVCAKNMLMTVYIYTSSILILKEIRANIVFICLAGVHGIGMLNHLSLHKIKYLVCMYVHAQKYQRIEQACWFNRL